MHAVSHRETHLLPLSSDQLRPITLCWELTRAENLERWKGVGSWKMIIFLASASDFESYFILVKPRSNQEVERILQ